MISRGCCSPEMSKFCSERWVCAPQSLSAGTSMGPKVSRSVRVVMGVPELSKWRARQYPPNVNKPP